MRGAGALDEVDGERTDDAHHGLAGLLGRGLAAVHADGALHVDVVVGADLLLYGREQGGWELDL